MRLKKSNSDVSLGHLIAAVFLLISAFGCTSQPSSTPALDQKVASTQSDADSNNRDESEQASEEESEDNEDISPPTEIVGSPDDTPPPAFPQGRTYVAKANLDSPAESQRRIVFLVNKHNIVERFEDYNSAIGPEPLSGNYKISRDRTQLTLTLEYKDAEGSIRRDPFRVSSDRGTLTSEDEKTVFVIESKTAP